MAKKTLYGILLLITTLCCLTGCEDDPYDDPYEIAKDNLCRTTWLDNYVTNDGRDCVQELEFHYDYTGYDYRTYYYPNGAIQEEKIPFLWEWDEDYFDALYIDYPDREGSWLENIRFGNDLMKCKYDGVSVTFKASY